MEVGENETDKYEQLLDDYSKLFHENHFQVWCYLILKVGILSFIMPSFLDIITEEVSCWKYKGQYNFRPNKEEAASNERLPENIWNHRWRFNKVSKYIYLEWWMFIAYSIFPRWRGILLVKMCKMSMFVADQELTQQHITQEQFFSSLESVSQDLETATKCLQHEEQGDVFK